MSPDAAVEDPAVWSDEVVPERYRHDWQLFVDWCTATDRTALPADSDTVIGFLDAHPATRSTNRRRLSAIRWIHQHARALAPHRTTELRSRVLPDTSRRIDVDTIRPLLEDMPTSGWTAGLVGRRDALLLVLTAHGVSYAAMERLHRRDVVVDDHRCLVVTLPDSVVRIAAAPGDPRTCPVAVYLWWARLLAYHDRYPSTIALEKALRAAQTIGNDSVERYQALPEPSRDGREPLLPTIDRWGQFGTPRGSRHERWGMDADSTAKLVRARLAGEAAPRYLTEKADPQGVVDGIDKDQDHAVARPLPPMHSDGALLRHRDTQRPSDLEDSFDDIERRTDALTTWIESILSGHSRHQHVSSCSVVSQRHVEGVTVKASISSTTGSIELPVAGPAGGVRLVGPPRGEHALTEAAGSSCRPHRDRPRPRRSSRPARNQLHPDLVLLRPVSGPLCAPPRAVGTTLGLHTQTLNRSENPGRWPPDRCDLDREVGRNHLDSSKVGERRDRGVEFRLGSTTLRFL